MFQSTHSLRSATPTGEVETIREIVSIHALLAECDRLGDVNYLDAVVSIHALLAECDFWLLWNPDCSMWFQSTHSLRSATQQPAIRPYHRPVSIHALLAECDIKETLN